MEEPPKVERIISSRGVSIDNAASLLKLFLSKIDQYDDSHDEGDDFFQESRKASMEQCQD